MLSVRQLIALGTDSRRRRIREEIARPVDESLIWAVVLLIMLGLVMVYSSSIALPESARYGNFSSVHFLLRHAISMVIGLCAGLVAFAVPPQHWQRFASYFFVGGLVLLALVLIPGIGREVLGARRWIPLGIMNLQPSEVMKLLVVLYAADYTVRKQEVMQRFRKGILPMGFAVALVGLLLNLEPDLGAFIVICGIAAGMLFLGGINGRLFAALVFVSLTSFVLVIAFSDFRRERIFAYLDPFAEAYKHGKGYQLGQSLIAFGRGEWFGVGLGASVEKLHYLPEPHTDFLLAVIGEELGLIGVLIVIGLFFWLVRRIFDIGRQAIALDQTFNGMVAYGIALWLACQAFINMGVNLGVLPTKGLTLPLMSYGGSALLFNMISIAIVLRIDFENRRLMRGGR
ncbi:MAG: putative lipid II flippase FtsW [Burkholderiaceae bacterium]